MMRIIFNDCRGEMTVLEISYATYSTEVSYYDTDGNIRCSIGLHMVDTDGDYWVLADTPKSNCETILEKLFETGLYDFRNKFLDTRIYCGFDAESD